MPTDRFDAEKNYLAARQIAMDFLRQALLTPDEFSKIDALLIAQFQPPLGKLFSENPTELTCNSGPGE